MQGQPGTKTGVSVLGDTQNLSSPSPNSHSRLAERGPLEEGQKRVSQVFADIAVIQTSRQKSSMCLRKHYIPYAPPG